MVLVLILHPMLVWNSTQISFVQSLMEVRWPVLREDFLSLIMGFHWLNVAGELIVIVPPAMVQRHFLTCHELFPPISLTLFRYTETVFSLTSPALRLIWTSFPSAPPVGPVVFVVSLSVLRLEMVTKSDSFISLSPTK
ncbi:MAG: hypothetical protein CMO80_21845 [Verrucomicrobiales bacterium]|nr:hypothetical protein [Verrucomicrobiales bacterium]